MLCPNMQIRHDASYRIIGLAYSIFIMLLWWDKQNSPVHDYILSLTHTTIILLHLLLEMP
jgi:hypothetical protein